MIVIKFRIYIHIPKFYHNHRIYVAIYTYRKTDYAAIGLPYLDSFLVQLILFFQFQVQLIHF